MPLLSSNQESIPMDIHKIDGNTCMRDNRCKSEQGEAPNSISCHDIPPLDSTLGGSGSCYLWGSVEQHDEQMLFIFLLRINAHMMTLHYFNNSQNGQQYLSRQHQVCTAGNGLDIRAAINGSCMDQESPAEVLPNEQVACCRNLNANFSIDFYERIIEMHFYNSIIELSVDYLNCTRKFKDSIIQRSYETLFYNTMSYECLWVCGRQLYRECACEWKGLWYSALVQFSCYQHRHTGK